MQDTSYNFKRETIPGLDIALTAVTTDEGRVYTTPEGKIYPSASTITKVLTRDVIAAWRKRVGTEAADKKTKRGADRGSHVHLICEKYLLGTLSLQERLGMMPTTKELFLQLKKKLDNHVEVVYAIEQALYSDRLQIAGRTDAIVLWDGEIAILDFKTSEKPKPDEWILNYFVQCAAYAEMFEERTGRPIRKIVVAMATETETIPTVYIKEKDAYLPVLQKCIETYRSEHP